MSLRGKNTRKLMEWQAPLPSDYVDKGSIIEVDNKSYINFLMIDYTLNRFISSAVNSWANKELLKEVWHSLNKDFLAFKGRLSKDGKKIGYRQVFYDTEFLTSFLIAYRDKKRPSTNFLLPASLKCIARILEYLEKERQCS